MVDFKKLCPSDGFFSYADETGITFGLESEGNVVVSKQVSVGKVNETDRLNIVGSAIAEFINAGGAYGEVIKLVENVSLFLVKSVGATNHNVPVLDYGPYEYFAYGVTNNNSLHEFFNPETKEFVRWERNSYVDVGILDELGTEWGAD